MENMNTDRVYIIAEAEINHNGDFNTAKKMINSAKECGADCIKFQFIIASEIAEKGSSFFSIFQNSELTIDEFVRLRDYAENEAGIEFIITAPSVKSYDILKKNGFNRIKIGSSNLTNLLLLKHISDHINCNTDELLISTGASTLENLSAALGCLPINEVDNKIVVFHCTSIYPAEFEDLNLNVIPKLVKLFPNIIIGYSDHTIGSLAAISSVSLGARVIEKHFTLDKSQNGPDHSFSSDPKDFKEYVSDIRNTELSLGSGIKEVSSSEKHIVKNIRRYLVFNTKVKLGSKLVRNMFDTKRIGDNNVFDIAVYASYIEIIEKIKSPKDYSPGDLLLWSDFGS